MMFQGIAYIVLTSHLHLCTNHVHVSQVLMLQTKLATWLLETCSVRNICGSASAKRWLEAAAQEGDKQAADKLAQLTL